MRELKPLPEFIVPLNDEQLQELGLFCAVWSQIDTLITMLLAKLCGTEGWAVDIMTGQATTAPRVNMLKRMAKTEPEQPVKKRIRDICDEMGGLLEDRNHLMHGLWAIYWAPNGDTEAASQFNKRRMDPIKASKLSSLTDRAARFSSELGAIAKELIPELKDGSLPRLIYVGPGDPSTKKPPKPLQVGSAIYGLDHPPEGPR